MKTRKARSKCPVANLTCYTYATAVHRAVRFAKQAFYCVYCRKWHVRISAEAKQKIAKAKAEKAFMDRIFGKGY